MGRIMGFSHLAFVVADLDRAVEFYCDKLGLEKMFGLEISERIREVLPDHPNVALIGKEAMVYISTGDNSFIELFRPLPGADLTAGGPNYDARGFAHLSLQVDDLKGYLEALKKKNVEIVSDISESPDGTYQAWIQDPDGNRIELMEYTSEALQIRKPFKIGINVMSLISTMNRDFEGTVDALKKGGADYLELMSDWGARQETIDFYAGLTGGKSGWDPENTVKRLSYANKAELPAKGMFIFDEALEEQADVMGQYAKENGITYAVLSFLNYEKGIESVYEKISLIKRAAAKLKPYGLQLVIHNHENDFVRMRDRDGKEKYVMDIFLEQLSKDEMMLELDTGWLLYAGVDYLKYIHDHIDRVMILHFKDICRDYEKVDRQDIFVPCGQGAVDFKAVLDAVPVPDKDRVLYVLDQDASKGDILEDQLTSVAYIKGLAKRIVL